MAVGMIGEEFAVTGTAQSLTTLLNLPQSIHFQTLALRANVSNLGIVWGGASDVTTGAHRRFFLRPGDALTIDINVGFCSTGQWYFVAASPGDIIHCVGAS